MIDHAVDSLGGGRRKAGRPKGSKSSHAATRELAATITARLAATPGRDVETILSEIQADAAASVPVRLAALYRLGQAMMGRLSSSLPAEAKFGEPRKCAGRPKGYRGTSAVTHALEGHVKALVATNPERPMDDILGEIVNSPAVATDVRKAALRRLAGALQARFACAIEAEGRRLR
ncbi:MAG: hypothetical protein ACOY3L_14300 [Pseudomonadota bacterium]